MKKIILPILAALALSNAGACSVKPGYFANGLMKTPSAFTSDCGMFYSAYRKGTGSSFRFVELYRVDGGRGTAAMKTITTRLQAAGYVMVKSSEGSDGKSHTFGFVSSAGKMLIIQLMVIGNQIFVAVGG